MIRDVNEHNRNVGQRVQEEIKVPDYQRRRGHEGGSRILDLRPHKGKERGRREEEEEERMLEIAIARASVSRDGDSSKWVCPFEDLLTSLLGLSLNCLALIRASDSERGSSLRRELGPKTGTSASAASCSTVAVGSSSKMDKYFSPAYDPRLDVSLDDITDPNTGLVREANYDDWERILGQVKEQKEEKRRAADERRREKQRKKEKKRRKEAEDRGGEEKKKKRKKRKRPDSSSESDHDKGLTNYKSTHAQRTARKELGLMDVEGYAKRGKVREWDLGKENPT